MDLDISQLYRTLTVFSIYHPPTPPSLQCPIILYLPRCGAPGHSETAPLPALASSSNSIVVCLNYRLSTRYQFPIPIHDVLAGYDWIRKHLVGRGPENWSRKEKLGVCGEFLGGSLASMLALTECHSRKQGSIAAAGIGNPVADWTSLGFEGEATTDVSANSALHAESVKKKLPSSGTIPWTGRSLRTESLLSARDNLFPQEDRFFDPFASPLLFFRGPAFDLKGLQLPESAVSSATADPMAEQPSDDDSASVIRNRLSHRKYPPRNSGLCLPQMRVELGGKNILKEQGVEFVKLMRRSVRLWEYQEKDDLYNDGSNRIELLERPEYGWWGDEEIHDLGAWFAQTFRR